MLYHILVELTVNIVNTDTSRVSSQLDQVILLSEDYREPLHILIDAIVCYQY